MSISIIEPKYVDSTNTRPHQPQTKTSISNLFIAGAHTKNSAELWSMEAAAESGRRAADMITKDNVTITQNRGKLLSVLTSIDNSCYSLGLPNISDIAIIILLVIIVAIIILLIVWFIYTVK